LDGGIMLLRRFAVAGSAPFDDVEFDGHGKLLSEKGVQEEFYRQATDIQFSGLKGGCTVMKGPTLPPVQGEAPRSGGGLNIPAIKCADGNRKHDYKVEDGIQDH
jgi:hypothetical protein